MKTTYIKDLQKNQLIDGEVFLIFDCDKNEDKNGKAYYNLTVGDKTGKLQAKIWGDKLPAIDSKLLKRESLVGISAKVEEFKGNLQLNIFDLVSVDESALEDFLQTSEFDADEMLKDVMTYVDAIKDEKLKKLLLKILNDPEVGKRFKYWPAAATVHHDFRSGLLQHVLEMLEISSSLKRFYPNANYDVLTAGIILHDMGKVYELDSSTISTDYSKEGHLIGHIVGGVMLFERFGGKELDENTYLHIVHLILSHHGVKEYGSPVLPATVEATMLTCIDNLSAKSRTAVKATNSIVAGEEFGSYNNFLSARIWNGGNNISDEEASQLSFD